jgi:outer membrane receptor protein involved in Fe transport
MTARYIGQRFRWSNQPGGLTLPGTGTHYRTDVHTFLATDALQFSNRSLGEARVQYARFTDLREDLNPSLYVYRAGYSVEGGLLGSTGFGAVPEHTWEGAYTFSFYVPSHTLRSGAGLKFVRAHGLASTYGRGAYYFAGPPATAPRPYQFVQSLAPSPEALEANSRSTSMFAFVQDDWRVTDRVSLNLGVRYDVEAVSNVIGVDVPTDTNNVQPRLGVTWDLRGNGRTVLRSGVGLYTQQHLLYPINRLELEGPPGAAVLTVADGSPLMPVFPALLPPTAVSAIPRDTHRLDAGFRNPYALQTAVGVQREIFGGVLSADVVWLRGRELTSLVDVNAPESVEKPAQRTVAEADATRPLYPAPGAFRKIITLGNEGRSWYRGLQIKFDRSAGPVQALGSYAMSRAEDMASYQLPEDSRNIPAEKARASTDVQHNVAAGLTWMLPGRGGLAGGWSLSGVTVVRSNRPYTISWGDDRNGTTQNDARPGDRNTGRTGAYRTIDLALSRHMRRGRADIEARVEAYNLLDAVNYDQYVGELLSPSFAQPISAFPQRRLQLAVVTRF